MNLLNITKTNTIQKEIGFSGLEKNSQKTIISNPSIPSKPIYLLPSPCDKTLMISAVSQADYLNEADITRYKKIQDLWVKDLSKRLKIPVENIKARLPEIVLGDAKEMTSDEILGAFCPSENVIEINPIRELANLKGGDEARIVHESVHGYLYNLGIAYSAKISPSQIHQKVTKNLMQKILNGENAIVIKGKADKVVNGKNKTKYKMMHSPYLTEDERVAFLKTLNLFSKEHFADNLVLNDEGKAIIKKYLLPKLENYKKLYDGPEEVVEKKICERMSDCVTSFFYRQQYLKSYLISQGGKALGKNLQTPLTASEKKLANAYIKGELQTQEGNILVLEDTRFFRQSKELYFTSFEEMLARKEQSLYRLKSINRKIRDIQKTGISPAEILLEEKKAVQNNLKLLKKVEQFIKAENEVNAAPRDLQKLIEIKNSSTQMENILKELDELKKSGDRNAYIKKRKEFLEKTEIYNDLTTPDKLLADSFENNNLKAKYCRILDAIKKLAPDCDLTAIPKRFFPTEESFAKNAQKTSCVVKKWASRLA